MPNHHTPFHHLSFINGIYHHNHHPFTGLTVTHYPNKSIKEQFLIINGKYHGLYRQWSPNGTLIEQRHYLRGEKVGTHRGWYPDASLKFRYQFNTKGQYHGPVREWYPNQQLYKSFNFVHGVEHGRQQLFKSDGNTHIDLISYHGKRYGHLGQKMCKGSSL
ncbi:hypothetical protein DID76_01105 [Candidatus Marinamargulisbacteria bacterium SCGC AG-414-C22]|nr:hypothetical protein DID76_01105 [Candidatus Marinamargulisbacteria bacterium SCGC AG-414-C22]